MPKISKNILILSPHPDDEVLGCGGTVAKLSRQGAVIDCVFFTAGEAGNLERRCLESLRAGKTIGIRNFFNLGGTDGRLAKQIHKLTRSLAQSVSLDNYDCIFCPWQFESHPDHRAVFRVFQKLVSKSEINPEILLYEVWSPLPENYIEDISSTLRAKLKAIRHYRSQLRVLPYDEYFEALARYRAMKSPKAQYAEAFIRLSRSELLAIRAG